MATFKKKNKQNFNIPCGWESEPCGCSASSENVNIAHTVVGGGIANLRVDTLPDPRGRDPVASLEAKNGSQENPFSHLLS